VRRAAGSRDQVTRDAAEVGVDDEVEQKVDGEVAQQQEVGEVRGGLEGAVRRQPCPPAAASRRQGDEDEQVRRRDEQRE